LRRFIEGGQTPSAPTTGAKGAATKPRHALDPADEPERHSKKNRQSAGKSYP
jgi:hypothetical protein